MSSACSPARTRVDRAVMVAALDVDDLGEPALPLRHVIRDVGHEVRVAAVGLAHHAVLVVAVVGGAQPQRALAARTSCRKRRARCTVGVDAAVGVERAFEDSSGRTSRRTPGGRDPAPCEARPPRSGGCFSMSDRSWPDLRRGSAARAPRCTRRDSRPRETTASRPGAPSRGRAPRPRGSRSAGRRRCSSTRASPRVPARPEGWRAHRRAPPAGRARRAAGRWDWPTRTRPSPSRPSRARDVPNASPSASTRVPRSTAAPPGSASR